MTSTVEKHDPLAAPESTGAGPERAHGPDKAEPENPKEDSQPQFILYFAGEEYRDALRELSRWVKHLLIPVYGREVTSNSLWCSRWWEHAEAVAQFYGLWMAWQDYTGPGSTMAGPAMWHRDYVMTTLSALRGPDGPFAGCKPGMHRPREPIHVEEFHGLPAR